MLSASTIGSTLAALIFFSLPPSISGAATLLKFQGRCVPDSSRSLLDAQGRATRKTPIRCDSIFLIELDGGRNMVAVTDSADAKSTPLEFAGSSIDEKTNPVLAFLPMDSIYPSRKAGPSPDATMKMSSAPGSVLRGARGMCFFANHRLEASKNLACAVFYAHGGLSEKYSITFDVTKSSVGTIPQNSSGAPGAAPPRPRRGDPIDYNLRASQAVANKIRYVRMQEEQRINASTGAPRNLATGECSAVIPIDQQGALAGPAQITCDNVGLVSEMSEAIRLAAPYAASPEVRSLTVRVSAPVPQPGVNG